MSLYYSDLPPSDGCDGYKFKIFLGVLTGFETAAFSFSLIINYSRIINYFWSFFWLFRFFLVILQVENKSTKSCNNIININN